MGSSSSKTDAKVQCRERNISSPTKPGKSKPEERKGLRALSIRSHKSTGIVNPDFQIRPELKALTEIRESAVDIDKVVQKENGSTRNASLLMLSRKRFTSYNSKVDSNADAFDVLRAVNRANRRASQRASSRSNRTVS